VEEQQTVKHSRNSADRHSAGQSYNGVEHGAPALEVDQPSIELKILLEKHEKMTQGLNAVTADCDALAERLTQQEENKKRTEGALIMLTSLIQELDPQALSRQQGR